MKKILFLLCPMLAVSQVTLRVTSIPANTPVGSTIFMAGTVNGWNPSHADYALTARDGIYTITIPEGTGTVEYKFTRGDWETAEANATGGHLPNRNFTFNGKPQTIDLTIQSWQTPAKSTAAANVSILDDAFAVPQLNTTRRIWLYLPPDYDTSTKRYPVLYMHDGQNLFDAKTSFSGEWGVDETLNELFEKGDYGAIVVGIDNGGPERLNEYSPWSNAEYAAGGKGAAYMEFVAGTLKPYIDANYRTRPEPQFNALIGSSMGGLISTYGALQHPKKFLKIGSLSPAYWFALDAFKDYISGRKVDVSAHRIFVLAGTNEWPKMVETTDPIVESLQKKGVKPNNLQMLYDPQGTHTEAFWQANFGRVYQWLFADVKLD
jgi:predicted alpha/beta superfamily hydrolase